MSKSTVPTERRPRAQDGAQRVRPQHPLALGAHPGELVRVRSASEIFATLDERGTLDGLPFMPEMLKYCGRTLPVAQRADKTCAGDGVVRRMRNTVHLRDSAATALRMTAARPHASCSGRRRGSSESRTAPGPGPDADSTARGRGVRRRNAPSRDHEGGGDRRRRRSVYRCQATEIPQRIGAAALP